MPYKRGRPPIDLSPWFSLASAAAFYMTIPIAMLFNFMQHRTRYRHRWRLRGIRRAISVSNHTTVLDPVKISFLFLPRLIFQTMLEATVEFPALGTFTRLLGGVPLPRGRDGYRRILGACAAAFGRRRYVHFYPEGECFLYSQRVMEFKPGAFRIAAELGVPVVPLVTVFSAGRRGPWPWPPLGRSTPAETLVVLEPEFPENHIRRDEGGEITPESVREFAEAVRARMQAEIDRRGGTHEFFRGQMARVRGLND